MNLVKKNMNIYRIPYNGMMMVISLGDIFELFYHAGQK